MENVKRNSNGSQGPDLGYNTQQIMEIGEAAAQTLGSPIYNLVHRQAVDEILQEWAQTAPKETARREDLWREYQCLAKAAMRMQNHVARAQEVLENQSQEDRRRQDEYLDSQGFGFADDLGVGKEQFQ